MFGTQVVALRHKGPLRPETPTLAEILREAGYDTTCVGLSRNPSSRGFNNYFAYTTSGTREDGSVEKAHNLNQVLIPELDRMVEQPQPFFVTLRHMDPHTPYMPPNPFKRMFYHGDEFDPSNQSMQAVFDFKPFKDYFYEWMPEGVTDKDYINAQYDGAIAYMDMGIKTILTFLETKGVLDETIVVLNSDHGETLYEHDCWYDHHGLYDSNLHVPLMIRYPKAIPQGLRIGGYSQHKDLLPTLLELADVNIHTLTLDGHSLMPMITGEQASHDSEIYITECTWMRKHGWRTPQWKLIVALEPDFHFKTPVELYNLVEDPREDINLANEHPDIVAMLSQRMDRWITSREKQTGLQNPIHNQGDWHGIEGIDAFQSSQQAYDTLRISSPRDAERLQAKSRS